MIMNKLFISLTFTCIALWLIGFLFMNTGLEIHLLLIMAAMIFALKLIKDELNSTENAYL
jgi:hypothetical protein